MRSRVELLLLLACVACGGHSVESERQPTPSQGGAPSRGGATSQPEPEPEPEPTCVGVEPICVPDCESLERVTSTCVGTTFQCQNGWVSLDSCGKNACARRARTCCAPNGETDVPECAADGTIGDCPAGFTQTSTCVPQGYGIKACSELVNGSACTSDDQVCYKDRCGFNCYCNPDATDELRWECSVNAC